MPDTSSPYVLHGESYVDYDRPWGNRRQLLVTLRTADILTNTLAVFLTLAMKSVFNILRRLWTVYWHGDAEAGESPASSSTPLQTTTTSDATTSSRSRDPSAQPASRGSRTSSTIDADVVDPDADISRAEIESVDSDEIDTIETDEPETHPAPSPSIQDFDEIQQPSKHNVGSLEEGFSYVWGSFGNVFKSILPQQNRLSQGSSPGYGRQSHWTRLTIFVGDLKSNVTKAVLKELGKTTVFLIVLLVLYVGGIILGVLSSAIIISDSVALSRHPHCGVFLDSKSNNASHLPYESEWRRYLYDFEDECGQYARSCYTARHRADGCNFFYEQSLNYTVKHNDTCPFRGDLGYLCHDGPESAFTLSTGRVKAKALGINSPYHYSFERSTTCSPLVMDDRFVRYGVIERPNGKKYTGFRYLYGNRTGDYDCTAPEYSNCTFEVRLPSIEQSAFESTGYTLRQEMHDPTRHHNWQPIFMVNSRAGETVTMMFINNLGVFYPRVRDDPIFFANTKQENTRWYFNNRLHAGVLACMDRTMYCPPNGAKCVPSLLELEYHNAHDFAVRTMLMLGLVYSSIGDSVRYRRAEALDAQAKVSSPNSIELAREQWKVEAQQLFETSLARIQISLRNIARYDPLHGPVPDQEDYLPPHLRQVCNMFKFRSVGYRNVSVSHLSGIVCAAVFVFLVGLTTEDNQLRSEKPIKWSGWARFGRWLKSLVVQLPELISRCWNEVVRRGPLRRSKSATLSRRTVSGFRRH